MVPPARRPRHSERKTLLSPLLWIVVGGLFQLTALSQSARAGVISLIRPSEAAAAAQSGQWKVLDVRPVPGLEYISGHLPNAVHISEQSFRGPNGKLPYQIWAAGDLANLLSQAGISNRDQVLVYSDGTNVLGASLVAYILEKSGLPRVAIVDGGFSGYKAAGQPVTKAFPSFSTTTFKPTFEVPSGDQAAGIAPPDRQAECGDRRPPAQSSLRGN